jgi:hypothetical protein
MRVRIPPLFPFLLASWPPLALAARNPDSVYRVSHLAVPLLTAWLVTALGWLAARTAGLSSGKSQVTAALVALSWWGFRVPVDLLQHSPIVHDIGVARWSGWIAVAALGGAGYLMIRRLPDGLGRASTFLNLVAVLLVGSAVVSLGRGWAQAAAGAGSDRSPTTAGPLLESGRPDVYLVVLDAYSGARTLSGRYGFDNSTFLARLRARGFTLPRSVRSNYPHTHLALASLLNWNAVQAFEADLTHDPKGHARLKATLEDNPTWRYFARRGYRIAFYPSVREITGKNRYAREGFAEEPEDFPVAWQVMTPVPEARRAWRAARGLVRGPDTAIPRAVRLNDRRFSELGRLHRPRRPVFAFAHLLLPHQPFVYHADCRPRHPAVYPAFDRSVSDSGYVQGYLEQLQCVNQRVLGVIDTILARTAETPIILLLSDHGLGSRHFDIPALGEASPALIDERLDGFAAVLVPDSVASSFRGDVTPTGVLRDLMRTVFGLALPPLDLPSYWSSSRRSYDFTLIDHPGSVP